MVDWDGVEEGYVLRIWMMLIGRRWSARLELDIRCRALMGKKYFVALQLCPFHKHKSECVSVLSNQ